jgi:uncharacterized RDD family membrane protein YckC
MDSKIDFTSYTLEELESAAEFIDSDQYPGRAEEIDHLIKERSTGQSEKIDRLIKERAIEQPAETDPLIKERAIEQPEALDNTKRVGDKATRTDRFSAAIIDGLIGIIALIPIFIYVDLDVLKDPSFSLTLSMFAYGLVVSFLLHGYLLYYYGQTIGKNFMSIRIEDLDDTKAELSTIYLKRILPMQVLALVPFGGQFIAGIVNPLFIFGKEKRCLHDYVAKTKVCYTNN